jgi:endonuclease YncB( thermonuclease family)
MFRLLSVLVVALLLCARPSAAEFSSYAVLQEDASLVIQNRVVRLFGIYIPDHGQFCDTQLRPAFCGNRAATALNFKIQGFVTCQEMGTYDDGSISAVCWTRRSNFSEGTDLGAYLIREGLALAGPDAPFEYQALERIAQTNSLGVWGFQADQFRFRRFH